MKTKPKKLCLAKFEVLGYKNMQRFLRIISISDPQISLNRLGARKNDRN